MPETTSYEHPTASILVNLRSHSQVLLCFSWSWCDSSNGSRWCSRAVVGNKVKRCSPTINLEHGSGHVIILLLVMVKQHIATYPPFTRQVFAILSRSISVSSCTEFEVTTMVKSYMFQAVIFSFKTICNILWTTNKSPSIVTENGMCLPKELQHALDWTAWSSWSFRHLAFVPAVLGELHSSTYPLVGENTFFFQTCRLVFLVSHISAIVGVVVNVSEPYHNRRPWT